MPEPEDVSRGPRSTSVDAAPDSSPVVVFQPSGRRAPVTSQGSLLDLAHAAGVELDGACGGKGLCGKCKVRLDGPPPPPPGPTEEKVLGPLAEQGFRLACQTSLPQGGSVWVPPREKQQGTVILTEGAALAPSLDPAVKAVELLVPEPALEGVTADRERLAAQLAPHLSSDPPDLPLAVMRQLPAALKAERGRVTVALWQGKRVLDVAAGHGQPCLGLAVDLGTTTVVAYLLDLADGATLGLASAVNPQVVLGDDVISRISHAGGGQAQLEQLRDQARRCVNQLADEACRQAGVSPRRIMECVLVGNTAMHHLFLGLDPGGLAVAPYAPAVSSDLDIPAREAGLDLAPGANLHLLPVKAGFVGADAVAVALALGAENLEEPTLILDLGTNGEMILAHSGNMLCCSTAAGPALEGGHITWGMRGAPGAVDAVEITSDLEPRLRVIGGGAPLGLCGSGVISVVAGLLGAGALEPNGSFASGLSSPRLRSGPGGTEYVLAWSPQTGMGQDLVITAQDVAEVQLAKGAVHAGVSMMLHRLGLTAVTRVLLAGAFGNYLDPVAACAIGLFPRVGAEVVQGVGNAAGAGAKAALLNRDQRRQARDLAQRMGYLELAACPEFQEYFVEGMVFPAPSGCHFREV